MLKLSNEVFMIKTFPFEGAGSRNENKLLSKRQLGSIFMCRSTLIFHYFSQNESVILKIDCCTS